MITPQDSYKDDKLFYGALNSRQRIQLKYYRMDKFRDLFIENFPEVYLRLISSDSVFYRFIHVYGHKSHFKYIEQLANGIKDSSLENVTTEEFNTLIKRFKNHLHHKSKKTLEDIHEAIQETFPFPLPY